MCSYAGLLSVSWVLKPIHNAYPMFRMSFLWNTKNVPMPKIVIMEKGKVWTYCELCTIYASTCCYKMFQLSWLLKLEIAHRVQGVIVKGGREIYLLICLEDNIFFFNFHRYDKVNAKDDQWF